MAHSESISIRYLIAERSKSGELAFVAGRLTKREAEDMVKQPTEDKESPHITLEALPYQLGELNQTLSKLNIVRRNST